MSQASQLITVATLNLRNRADRWAERRHLLVEQLVEVAPDLLSLQEISFPIGQGKWLVRQLNARLSGSLWQPYRLIQRRKRHLVNGFWEGIGILTKLPVSTHDLLHLGYGGRLALRVNVTLPAGQSLDFVATHLHHVAFDKEARLEQVMALIGWLNGQGRVPLQIVAGDFNEMPNGPAISQMKQMYRSAYALARGFEPLATFPTALVKGDWASCLDYIFVSPAVQVATARIFCDRPAGHDPTLYPSDHVGLVATLKIA